MVRHGYFDSAVSRKSRNLDPRRVGLGAPATPVHLDEFRRLSGGDSGELAESNSEMIFPLF
jgi:hypothetical protein